MAARSVIPLPAPEPPSNARNNCTGIGWPLSNGSATTFAGSATAIRVSTAPSKAHGFTLMPLERAYRRISSKGVEDSQNESSGSGVPSSGSIGRPEASRGIASP
ncbi:hypothetical protein OZX73_03475 [Bifidobacterium sp. ESL0775]|uniref:hypothetical protein n=1 Tax=Bifidobacterium sp. ESL0775 TaxID=2983230 RepID=UPI0023F9A66C|nr:hypothetical protein [Bifidobacterium sp. ESL0775]WEV69933.1 hypothetical protein OZX73_03475 [Bifidobacterium sp. ESL0775]